MKHIITKFTIFGLFWMLTSYHVHRTSRNPQIRKKCPVHNEILIQIQINNERGIWSSINFDKRKTPYPKVGISIGCVGRQFESVIKYCPKCGNGHEEFKKLKQI